MSIKILIDSASDITKEEAKNYGIELIPLIVNIEGKDYFDGVDLNANEFYEKLVECNEIPKTSQITPSRFIEKIDEMLLNDDQILIITLSSKLSGTYSSAVIASLEYLGKVFVVDSLSATIGERLLCEYALKLIQEGLTINQIIGKLNIEKNKINIIAMVNTLEFLKKGGRISSAALIASELFSIKPVLSLIDGEIKMIGKAIGSKKGNNLLNKLITNKGGINFNKPYGVVWSGFNDSVLKKYIQDCNHLWKDHTDIIPSYIIGSTIGTHVGPGVIGFAFFEK